MNTDLTFKLPKHLIYKKVGPGYIVVEYTNTTYMGDMLCGDDGYYAWWPEYSGRVGYIDSRVLRELADTLDELNEEWDNIVQNDPAISQKQGEEVTAVGQEHTPDPIP